MKFVMDELKNFIEENREEFECEALPCGHEERFLKKLPKKNGASRYYRFRYGYYLAASSVVILLVLTPLLYFNRIQNERNMNAADYITILQEKSHSVSKMAEQLDSHDKNMVLSTLDQLTFEAVPFDSQLSADIRNGERRQLIKSYYSPKIEGMDKLEKYVKQLLTK